MKHNKHNPHDKVMISTPSWQASTRLRGRRRRSCSRLAMCFDSPEIHQYVMMFLCKPKQLAIVLLVSREWHTSIRDDAILWRAACQVVWESKAFISKHCQELSRLEPRRALKQSVAESVAETVSAGTLCSQRWWFRFKKQAGIAWTRDDPYWRGDGARELRFLMPQSADDAGVLHWHCGGPDDDLRDPGESRGWVMRWRLQQLEESGKQTTILRVKHDHFSHEFPGVRLIRHPRNWGFVFHSVWVVYASFPMSREDDDRYLTDRGLARSLGQWQWREVEEYNNDIEAE